MIFVEMSESNKHRKKAHLSIANYFAVVLTVFSLSAHAAESYNFVTKWGSLGVGDGQFKQPYGVAVDSGGSVYVVDLGNNRIQKFTANGQFLTKWGYLGSEDGQFNEPVGIAVDSGGNVYVVEKANSRIQKFTANGQFLTKWGSYGKEDGQFQTPSRITIDSNGNVYVVEHAGNRIQKFTADGQFVTKWGSYGTGDGQLRNPVDIAVDSSSGSVYVSDYGNSRIQKFTANGQFVTKWGYPGTGDGQFDIPWGIAVDSSGNVYVTDRGNNSRIQKFTASGQFLTKWGSLGGGNDQFNSPWVIEVDGSGSVYVADVSYHRIQKFSSTLNQPPLAQFTASVAQSKVSLDASASSDADGSISRYDWLSSDGQTASGKTASFSFSSANTYRVTLTVTDDKGATSQIFKDLVIQQVSNQPPVAQFTASVAQNKVSLDASASSDADGSISRYDWLSSDGQTASGKTASFSFSSANTYRVTLTVTDDKGATSQISKDLVIQQVSNQPPVAQFTASVAQNKVSLDASASSDADGSISRYDWLSSDGQTASGKTASFSFSSANTYRVTLTVTDDKGATSQISKDLAIQIPNTSDNTQTSVDILAACAKNPTPATYDPATKKVTLPALDIPVLDIFTGMPTGDIAQCNGMLQMQPGIEDFKIDKIACTGITDKYNLNSAQYLYFSANTPFANGGTLLICADVPRVITIPPTTQIVVAPERYLVTMKQLAVSPDIFHVEKVEKPGKSDLPLPNDCTNPDVKALVQSQLVETFSLFRAVNPLVVVDYDSSGVWSYPITRSVNPPTGVFTKTFETGATGTYIDGVLKTKTESSTIQDQIAGKRLRFTFNETTRSFSCKNQSGISVAEQIPANCLTGISPSLPGLCDI